MNDYNNNTNRRTVLKTLGVGMAGVGLAGCQGGGGGGGSSGEVTVGLLLPSSGAFGGLGNDVANGAKLGFSHMEEDGLPSDMSIRTVRGDTEGDAETALRAARQLIQQENVDIFAGAISSSVSAGIANFAAQQNIPFCVPVSTQTSITGSDCQKTTFRPTAHTRQIWETASPWLLNNVGKKVFFVYADYGPGFEVRDTFNKYVDETSDAEIVKQIASPVGSQEFSTVINQINSSDDAEAVFAWLPASQAQFTQQAANRGVDLPIVSESYYGRRAAGLGEDIINQLPAIYNIGAKYNPYAENDLNQRFVDAYFSEYDTGPDVIPYYGYRAAMFIANAVDKAGSANTDDIMSAIEELELDTPSGSQKIRACDHQGMPQSYMNRLTGVDDERQIGEVEVLDTVDTEETIPSCDTLGCSL